MSKLFLLVSGTTTGGETVFVLRFCAKEDEKKKNKQDVKTTEYILELQKWMGILKSTSGIFNSVHKINLLPAANLSCYSNTIHTGSIL